ncbi:MAG: metalloregulator ArsR/SmtB family transcription factor [Methanoregula sp.]|jgi:ArsR family transcriptional regulator|uniref:ArsR/SmtB family transcription factor n=1 Tax=Methanoregula sp. TaxID=2052170 RepID=UPI0025DF7EAF|nr:metalloregulator ArsR/SmtB family transcription factor [Methanoregula sp.]MCK9632436.1 metalloregulator ArsR/SmtB family transcription factor [Methanoregula sp.]
MKRVSCACCEPEGKNEAGGKDLDIPEQIQKELDAIGGFEALAGRVPDAAHLEEKSRIYHALSDPLRLTILYLIRDQPLCVCVINRFTRLSGSKLSYHLNILKEIGLIEGEYHGNWIIYSLTDTGREFLR